MWVAALRNPNSWIRQQIEADRPVAYSEPILMEVLSGTRSEREVRATQAFLARGPLVRFDAVSDFEGAAAIYAEARRRGFTPNSHVDCMIIAVAVRNELPLITLDRKQAAVAEIFGVTVM